MSQKIKRTKSKTYLLPLMSEVLPFEKKFLRGIVNTYIHRDDFDLDGMYLHIEHKFAFKNPEFIAYENKLKRSNLFVDFVDNGDNVVYTFKFPKEYENEYVKFIEGKYSEFGDDAKKLIMRFLNGIYLYDKAASKFLVRTYRVLYKDENLRREWLTERGVDIPKGQELESIMEIENETFKIEKEINADGI